MARTSESEVREIYGPHTDGTALSTTAVEFHIAAAASFVDTHLAGVGGLSNDDLRRIEALVACHLIASGDPTEQSFRDGDSQATFETPSNIVEGLRETRFGRRAILLDPTDALTSLTTGESSKAEFYGPT